MVLNRKPRTPTARNKWRLILDSALGAAVLSLVPACATRADVLALYDATGPSTSGTVDATNGPIGANNFYATTVSANLTASPLYANAPFNSSNNIGQGTSTIEAGNAANGAAAPSGSDTAMQYFRTDATAYGSGTTTPAYTLAPNTAGSITATSEATAKTANAYFSLTLTPASGAVMTITSLTFDVAQATTTNTQLRGFAITSSANNYSTDIAADSQILGDRANGATLAQWEAFNANGSVTLITSSGSSSTDSASTLTANQDTAGNAAFQNLANAVTFNFYSWTPGGGQGLAFDNITINGSVTPEPGTAILFFAVPLAALKRRRRR